MDIPTETQPQPVSQAVTNTSGQGAASVVPPEIMGWSWGGFFLNWIWGIFNGVYIALLALIPFVNLVMIFVLGIKGREWAWRNKKWESIEHFKQTQKTWAIAGLIVWILCFIPVVFAIFSAATIVALNPAQQFARANNSERTAEVTTIAYAVHSYTLAQGGIPSSIPSQLTEICGNNSSSCGSLVNLQELVASGLYIAEIPADPFCPEKCTTNGTGYAIARLPDGRVRVQALHAELDQEIVVER